jgi:phosphopantothenoylcysteine decarboxylase
MNQLMWDHPITVQQLSVLAEWKWFNILPPQVKKLACYDTGQGGMCDWAEIVTIIEKQLVTLNYECR